MPKLGLKKVNPKIGVEWNISDRANVRLGLMRTLKAPFLADRTIQPTQVAGFNQLFDDTNGTEAWSYGVGLDVRLTHNVNAGAEISRRSFSEPFERDDNIVRGKRDSDLYRAYLNWTPLLQWAIAGELQLDTYKRELNSFIGTPERVHTFSLPLSVRYFNSDGLFGGLAGTFVHQDVAHPSTRRNIEGNDAFFLVDASIGYRLPHRRGFIGLDARNLFDNTFKFQDDRFREFRDASSDINELTFTPFIPQRTIMLWTTLNF